MIISYIEICFVQMVSKATRDRQVEVVSVSAPGQTHHYLYSVACWPLASAMTCHVTGFYTVSQKRAHLETLCNFVKS